MPQPSFTSDSNWTRQPGAVSGIDGSKVFYEIPYRGAEEKSAAFRGQWKKGDQCPVPGFEHLYLIQGPTITDEAGGAASAVLRFEGPDISGEFGEPEPVVVTYHNEPRTVQIYADPTDPTYVTDHTFNHTANYRYNAHVAVASYTKGSRDTTPDALTGENELPPLEGLKAKESGGASAPEADAVAAGWFREVENSGFLSVTDQGDGNWSHEAYHEKIYEEIPWTIDRENT